MFRPHHQAPADDTALTPPSWGLNNSGGTGVNRGASKSNRAGSLPSSPISATVQGRAGIRGVEQLAARRAHNPEVVGSSPTPATKSDPTSRLAALARADGRTLPSPKDVWVRPCGYDAKVRGSGLSRRVARPSQWQGSRSGVHTPADAHRKVVDELDARSWSGLAPSSEPSDRVGQRSARRLNLLGSCAVAPRASRLPGSARPTVDGTRPANDDDVSLASVCGSALVVVGAFLLALVVYCW